MHMVSGRGNSTVQQLVEQIARQGHLTRRDYLQLTTLLLATHKLRLEERVQINRVFDSLQTGRLKLID